MKKSRPLRKAKLNLKQARNKGDLFEVYRQPDPDTSIRYVDGWDAIGFYGVDAGGQAGQVMVKLEHIDLVMTVLALVKRHLLANGVSAASRLDRSLPDSRFGASDEEG